MNDYRVVRCERARLLLSAELDGEAASLEAAGADAHARHCAPCEGWRAEIATVASLTRLLFEDAAPDLSEQILRMT